MTEMNRTINFTSCIQKVNCIHFHDLHGKNLSAAPVLTKSWSGSAPVVENTGRGIKFSLFWRCRCVGASEEGMFEVARLYFPAYAILVDSVKNETLVLPENFVLVVVGHKAFFVFVFWQMIFYSLDVEYVLNRNM